MRCSILALPLCVLLVADTFGLYSNERQLLEELQALEQGVAVSNDQQKITGVQVDPLYRIQRVSLQYKSIYHNFVLFFAYRGVEGATAR